MNLLRQIIQLLSESPGNIVYHVVTLFSLQAVFAIFFSQWRRNRESAIAARFMWAAGAILFVRLLLLGVGLVFAGDLVRATAVIPLLEQAINTATIMLLVWALVPHSDRLPRLGDLLLFMGLLSSIAMVVSFAQSWKVLATSGVAYNSTTQATVWTLLQIVLLGGGLLLTLADARWRRSLSPVILGLLLLAHLAHFWNYPEIIPTETNITYWTRLGYLGAFPLWAVMAYRQSLIPLVLLQRLSQTPIDLLEAMIQRVTKTIGLSNQTAVSEQIIQFMDRFIDASFVGIATLVEGQEKQLRIVSNQPQAGANRPRVWYLNMTDWSPFELVMIQKQMLELQADGSGAGQLHRLYETMEIGSLGSLLLHPLSDDEGVDGLIMMALLKGDVDFSAGDRRLLPSLAAYAARLLADVAARAETQALPVVMPPLPETAVSGQIIALEEARTQLQEQLTIATDRLKQSEARTVEASGRAQNLAAMLHALEQQPVDARVLELEQEVETLRESLIEAEEAMAMAAAAEGGLSTEWVMLTITRYSGQLEEAQAQIASLEHALAGRKADTSDPVLLSLVQELRTPMTSIAGFTQLLLSESMGLLGVKQRDLLQRIHANSQRMGTLLEQLVQLSSEHDASETGADGLTDVREVVETAVSSVITQLREKRLHLDLEIGTDLPQLAIPEHDLYQIISNLLGNACQVSENGNHISLKVQTNSILTRYEADQEKISFLHVMVTDSGGGVPEKDIARVFAPQHDADMPLITGLGDRGTGLSLARQLSELHGGRIWLDSEPGVGSTFSLLFPLSIEQVTTEQTSVAAVSPKSLSDTSQTRGQAVSSNGDGHLNQDDEVNV